MLWMSLNSATNQILWNVPDISVKFTQKIKIVDFFVVLLLGTAGIPPPPGTLLELSTHLFV